MTAGMQKSFPRNIHLVFTEKKLIQTHSKYASVCTFNNTCTLQHSQFTISQYVD